MEKSRSRTAAEIVTICLVAAGAAVLNPSPATADTATATNPVVVTIPATGTNPGPSTPYPSDIVVSGMTGSISKVTVTLTNLTHTFPADIDALLVGPAGQNVLFMSDAGSDSDVNGVTLTFDDAAAAPLTSAQIVPGTFRPTNIALWPDTFLSAAPAPSGATALSTFNGTDPNGRWSLYVMDNAAGDVGSLAGGWTLSIETTTDAAPPSATPTQSPPANGAGWNNADVTVAWNWTDNAGGSGIDSANCTPSSTSSGEGASIDLAATCSDLAANTGSASYTVRVDKAPPTVTCGATPTFVVGSTPTSGVTASVTDAISGPVASPVSAVLTAADVASTGVRSRDLTGTDIAGNQTIVPCPYVVAYNFLGFLEPLPRTAINRNTTIPVKFRLGDASGAPISDAAAAALLSPTCRAQVTFDGQVVGCVRYKPDSDSFQLDVKTTRAMSVGAHTIGVRIAAPGGVVNTNSIVVQLR